MNKLFTGILVVGMLATPFIAMAQYNAGNTVSGGSYATPAGVSGYSDANYTDGNSGSANPPMGGGDPLPGTGPLQYPGGTDEPPGSFYYNGPIASPPSYQPPASRGVICPQYAMQCPDGSWASPSGPNCQVICPTSTDNSGGASYPGVGNYPLPGTSYPQDPGYNVDPYFYTNYTPPAPNYPSTGGGYTNYPGIEHPDTQSSPTTFFGGIGNFFSNIFSWWTF